MRRIFQVPSCKQSDGFSLVEVMVALAIVALASAAVATSILASGKVRTSAIFYRQAQLTAESLQVHAYNLHAEMDFTGIESEQISQDPQGRNPDWKFYTIRSGDKDRKTTLALKVGF